MKRPVSFENAHAFVNFTFFACTLILVLQSEHPLCLGVNLLWCLALVKAVRKAASLFKAALTAGVTVLVTVLFNAAFSHHGVTVIYRLGAGNPITLESVCSGAVQGVRLASSILLSLCLVSCITEEKLVTLLRPFSPRAALTASMCFRFIPLLTDSFRLSRSYALEIGLRPRERSPLSALRFEASRLSAVVTYALEGAVVSARSMMARGYGSARAARTSSKADSRCILVCAACLAAFSACLLCSFRLYAVYSPVITVNTPLLPAVLYSLFSSALFSLPIIMNRSEEKFWLNFR